MLIRFHVSNYLSFDEEVELSLIPGKVRKQHPSHVVESAGRHDIDILRAAIIYGANASGKSNLIKAMDFAKELIVAGTHIKDAIPRTRFKLRAETKELPSKFEFEFKVSDRCCVYGFNLDRQRIREEWLYEIRKTTETMLFERETNSAGETEIEFGKIQVENQKERDFLDFVAMGTRPNQLFLTESVERDVQNFQNVYQWFAETLTIIFPDSKYLALPIIWTEQNLGGALVKYLEQLGTGICGCELRKVDPLKEFPEELTAALLKSGRDANKSGAFLSNSQGSRYIVQIVDEELQASKLMLRHQMSDCEEEVLFDIAEESDGTRRLLDLLPGLTNQANKVFVVDEIDRSLHSKLSYELVKQFLSNEASESQLITTTHEAHLLDQKLLRRDEIWFVEKDRQGASHIYSLEEYAPRYDKDIEKGYMVGRYGAIPVFGSMAFGTCAET